MPKPATGRRTTSAPSISILRAQVLAAFCVPLPTSDRDLRDRAVTTGDAARFVQHLGSRKASLADFASKYEIVSVEFARMLDEGLVTQPHADLMDHHKPPSDCFSLTPLGASQAMAVLAASKSAGEGRNNGRQER